jgi:hypothetical protein
VFWIAAISNRFCQFAQPDELFSVRLDETSLRIELVVAVFHGVWLAMDRYFRGTGFLPSLPGWAAVKFAGGGGMAGAKAQEGSCAL